MNGALPSQLHHLGAALWPESRVALGRGTRTDAAERYLVLPTPTRPRLLVPDDDPRTSASAVANSSVGNGRSARFARTLVAGALRSGIGRIVPARRLQIERATDTPGLLDWLARATPGAPRSMAIRLGSDRPNQKPVLQLMDAAAQVVGYAKVGTNPLTRDLVTAEREALTRVQAAGTIVVAAPEVLAFATRGKVVVLAISPLPIPRHRGPASSLLVPAMDEIARMGPQGSHPVGSGPYGTRLRHRLAAVDDPAGGQLVQLVDALFARHGDRSLRLGGWHGDFRPWNVAAHGGRLLVWDWERHADEVPVGLDAVHYHHPLVAPDESTRNWQQRISADASAVRALLADLGVDPRDLELLTTLHLVEVLLRHLEDVHRHPAIRRDRDVVAGLDVISHRLTEM